MRLAGAHLATPLPVAYVSCPSNGALLQTAENKTLAPHDTLRLHSAIEAAE
jgi:hypothetical protein